MPRPNAADAIEHELNPTEPTLFSMIAVTKISDHEYEVNVSAATPTTHRVTLREDDFRRLGREGESAEELIMRSFAFLLEREPNTSILSSFDLPLIGRYFPEYETTIRRDE